ncbi:MAG: hypothetical protein OEY11_08630 [Gammaproteobacteria bacterium]|nr:hypothetical protein [Gammaproteobacteria bacterium]
MDNYTTLSQFKRAGSQARESQAKNYDIKLTLTREQISNILDYHLLQKIEQHNGATEDCLTIAESIKASQLSEQFCRFFTAELSPLLNQLMQQDTDSYAITNFHHRMLRKIANNGFSKKSA